MGKKQHPHTDSSSPSVWGAHDPDTGDVLDAVCLQERYQVYSWDAMIITSAARLGCRIPVVGGLQPLGRPTTRPQCNRPSQKLTSREAATSALASREVLTAPIRGQKTTSSLRQPSLTRRFPGRRRRGPKLVARGALHRVLPPTPRLARVCTWPRGPRIALRVSAS